MKVYQDLGSIPGGVDRVVTLGVFDGVHLGHQEVLKRLLQRAREKELSPMLLTFPNHPDELLRGMDVPMLCDLSQRLEIFESAGITEVGLIPFTRDLANMAAETFLREVFVGRCQAQHLVLGYDSHFGQGGKGNGHLAQQLAPQMGFEAEIVPPQLWNGLPISSTVVRKVLLAGEVHTAQILLGRPYSLKGRVVKGSQVGRTLGFPTANVLPGRTLLPGWGVYGARVLAEGETHNALVNVGVRPTVTGSGEVMVEAHILDFSGDLYDKDLTLFFEFRIRGEQTFENLDALKAQIEQDKQAALKKFG